MLCGVFDGMLSVTTKSVCFPFLISPKKHLLVIINGEIVNRGLFWLNVNLRSQWLWKILVLGGAGFFFAAFSQYVVQFISACVGMSSLAYKLRAFVPDLLY